MPEETHATHRIPVIDKTMAVLTALEGAPAGLSVVQIARQLQLSRTTVYRMLNTLQEHGMVSRPGADSTFALGPTLLRLARSVPRSADLASLARPALEALAAKLGHTAKISQREGDEVVVLAVAQASGAFSISAQVGRRFPLHAGGASKVLLAALGDAEIDAYLARRPVRHTAGTITDPAELRTEIARIRAGGWAEDRGEFVDGVRAVAAPVRNAAGDTVAAISVTFVAGMGDDLAEIADPVKASAAQLSRLLGA